MAPMSGPGRRWTSRRWHRAARLGPGDGARGHRARRSRARGRPTAGIELAPAGEDAARARLDAFLRDGIRRYPETRDLPGLDATSRLSPHLRWGAISGAETVRRARSALSRDPTLREGVRVWTRE